MKLTEQPPARKTSYRLLALSQGQFATVDTLDYAKCASVKWASCIKRRKDGSIYAIYAHRAVGVGRDRTTIRLHRFILGITDPLIHVDHKDHDGLNCRRSNLRTATRSQNIGNSRLSRRNKSGYKGVCWHKRIEKWAACICMNGHNKHLGYFPTATQAAIVYDRAALEYFGEFAHINFPSSL